MSNIFLEGFLEGLRMTAPFTDLSAKSRPKTMVWDAYDSTLLALRHPVHHAYLRKPALKPAAHDASIQAGLAVLAAFARGLNTRQALVRIEGDRCQTISFQPRPFGCNWTAAHAISPESLQGDWKDPLLEGIESTPFGNVVSTRKVVHLAGKVALAIAHRTGNWDASGQLTFEFEPNWRVPTARARWRSTNGGSSEVILEQ